MANVLVLSLESLLQSRRCSSLCIHNDMVFLQTMSAIPLQLILLVPIVGILACTFLWYTAKPKPIPGIPYNPASADRLLGDIPDSLAHLAETSELWSFFEQRCRELGSPIIQVFMRPFSKPWVILVDCRE